MTHTPNIKLRSIKLLEENIEEHLYKFGVGSYFFSGRQRTLNLKKKNLTNQTSSKFKFKFILKDSIMLQTGKYSPHLLSSN